MHKHSTESHGEKDASSSLVSLQSSELIKEHVSVRCEFDFNTSLTPGIVTAFLTKKAGIKLRAVANSSG